jgi:hypothetical protein
MYIVASMIINQKRYYFITGIICLLGLVMLGIIFFKERIAFSDMAYQAVYILIEQKPYINWVRAGSIIPQFIPLIAIWMHAGLKTVMIFHSVSFLVFFSVIYILAYRYSKKKLFFFIIPLYLVLITNEVFYWPQSELQQGMIWLCLYAVLLFENKWSNLKVWIAMCIHFAFILWIQFFHPLMFFPIVFLAIYYYDSETQLFTRKFYYYLLICIVSFGIRTIVGMFNTYEKGKLNIGDAIKNNLPHFLSLDSVHVFLSKLSSSYLIYISFLTIGIIWLIVNKKYLKLITLISFSFIYWVLIMISSQDDARFYTENMLLPLAFIAALPIVVDIIPAFGMRFIPALFFIVIIIRLGFIYYAHKDYSEHFSVYDPYFSYVKKNKLNGVFVDNKLIDQKKAIITWASGYESILISSLISPDSCRVVQIDNDPNKYSYALNYDTSLVTIYGVWGKGQLPKRYFRLAGGRYEIITKKP